MNNYAHNPESSQPDMRTLKEELQQLPKYQQLLNEAFLWGQKIIEDNPDPLSHETGGRKSIDPVTGVEATVTIDVQYDSPIHGTSHTIEYREHNPSDDTQDIVIEYNLDAKTDDLFSLTTTGSHPNVIDKLHEDGSTDDIIAKAVEATRERYVDTDRFATQEEIIQFHSLLEIAAFGNESFTFDTFQQQFKKAIADRANMRRDADHLAKNNPD